MAVAPIRPEISLDVLNQIDVRVGTIQSVEDVPGSDKLVKLTVGFGDHTRTSTWLVRISEGRGRSTERVALR